MTKDQKQLIVDRLTNLYNRLSHLHGAIGDEGIKTRVVVGELSDYTLETLFLLDDRCPTCGHLPEQRMGPCDCTDEAALSLPKKS